MVNWYKHDIHDWMDDTEGMDDAQYRVYHVICQLIYLHEGPIKRHDRGIAGRCNQDVRRTKRIISQLIDQGFLTEIEGQLSNARADVELRCIAQRRDDGRKGGLRSADVRRKALKSKDAAQPPLKKELNRLEKTRLDNKNIPHLCDEFENTFWPKYPHKVDRKAALKAFQKARNGVELQTIMDGLERYIEQKPPSINWAYPSTWLNKERWNDQPAPPAKQTWREENGTIYIKSNGPEGEAWQRFLRGVNDERKLAEFRYAGPEGEVRVRSRWPRRV